VLLDGSIEETLHHTMVSHTLDDISLQSMFGCQACRHEPPDIIRIVKHVLDCGVSLVDSGRISCQDDSLQDNPVSIGSKHRSMSCQKLPSLAIKALTLCCLTEHKYWTGSICHRAKDCAGKEGSSRGHVSFKLVLVTIQVVLGKDWAALPSPPSASEGENILALDWNLGIILTF